MVDQASEARRDANRLDRKIESVVDSVVKLTEAMAVFQRETATTLERFAGTLSRLSEIQSQFATYDYNKRIGELELRIEVVNSRAKRAWLAIGVIYTAILGSIAGAWIGVWSWMKGG